MERFFLNQKITQGQTITIEDAEIVHKISHVLRAKIGDEFKIFNGTGSEYLAKISAISKNAVALSVDATSNTNTESKIELNLYCGLIKKNRFETILEKCTEIGVTGFFPIISKRAVVQIESSPERWEKIIIEAAQQSGRTMIPKLHAPKNLSDMFEILKEDNAQIILASEAGGSQDVHVELQKLDISKPINLFIGPEGGWSPEELEEFKKLKAITVNLGERILRAETAAMVFSAFCIYLLQ